MQIKTNGTTLNCRLDGPSDGPVLVFSNSLATSMAMWDDQVSRLQDRYRILRYDNRGHGGSVATPGPYTLDLLARDVVGLLDGLEIDRVFFCGLSMGGMVGQWLGINAPERVSRLVLSNTASFFPNKEMWRDRIEMAERDGIPAIAIDPKGDLGNLLLTFPDLAPSDFRPWVDQAKAERDGITVDELAEREAAKWREGLASWGQDGKRIEALRKAVDLAIYTPGASHGRPLAVLGTLTAPAPELLEDEDAFRERVTATVSALLALAGEEADPLQSREHILLSHILEGAWSEGRDLDLEHLIRAVQAPGFDRVGVLDLESFYPEKESFELALQINNLLAAPGFQAWLEGEPLDMRSLLWTEDGKPRISILSIAHLSDPERMFLVTLVLNELLAWIRTRPGTARSHPRRSGSSRSTCSGRCRRCLCWCCCYCCSEPQGWMGRTPQRRVPRGKPGF